MTKVTVSAKTYTFTNGTANDATPVDASFTTLFNNDNDLKVAVNKLEDGNFNETASLTLNAGYGGSTPSANGLFQVERGTLANSALLWNETDDLWEATNNGVHYFPMMPKNYKDGCVVSYASASTITVKSGSWTDSTNKALIEVSSPLTVTLSGSTTGTNALDTGTEAANTWYYLYLIMKSADNTVAAILSTVNETVTGNINMPDGYNLKRQLPIAIRNDNSSNILPFLVGEGWPHRPKILYTNLDENGTYRVISGTHHTSFTSVSCTALVPPLSRLATLCGELEANSSGGNMYFRDPSNSGGSQTVANSPQNSSNHQFEVMMSLNTSQQFQYRVTETVHDAYAHVKAYVVTEMG